MCPTAHYITCHKVLVVVTNWEGTLLTYIYYIYIYTYLTCTLAARLRLSTIYIKYLCTCALGAKARAIKFKFEKETTWGFPDICKFFEISKLLRHCKKNKCLNCGQFSSFTTSNFQKCLPHGQRSLKSILWRKYNVYKYNINTILYIL